MPSCDLQCYFDCEDSEQSEVGQTVYYGLFTMPGVICMREAEVLKGKER